MKEHEKQELEYVKQKYFEEHPESSTYQFNNYYDAFKKGNRSRETAEIKKYEVEYYLDKVFAQIGIDLSTTVLANKLVERLHGMDEVEPVMATYPNAIDKENCIAVQFEIKGIDTELLPFYSDKCILSYAPNDKCLNSESFRYYIKYLSSLKAWNENELAYTIAHKVAKALQTDNVYVALLKVRHLDEYSEAEAYLGLYSEADARLSIKKEMCK